MITNEKECFSKFAMEIFNNSNSNIHNVTHLDFSNALHRGCIEAFFGGKAHMEKEYPEITKLYENARSSPKVNATTSGFVDAVYIFDVGYDSKKSVVYSFGTANLRHIANRIYTSIAVYKEGTADAIAYNAAFAFNKSTQEIACESLKYVIPARVIEQYTAVVTTIWEDNATGQLNAMVGGQRVTSQIHGASDEVVSSLTVIHPKHINSPETGNITVAYGRYTPTTDYSYPESRTASNEQKVYFESEGSVVLAEGHLFGQCLGIGAILECPNYGDIMYMHTVADTEIVPSTDKKSFTWKLKTDWNNQIPESVEFGDRTHSFDLQINFSCRGDGAEHVVIVSSKDYPAIRDKKHYKKISPVQLYWGCLAEDTKVRMADGSQKLIKDIRNGDIVATKNGVDRVVMVTTGTEHIIYCLKTEDSHEIKATYQHPFLTTKGFKAVSDFDTQTELIMADASTKKLLYCYPDEYDKAVYSLELENSDNFICEGLISGTTDVQGKIASQQPVRFNEEAMELLEQECNQLRRDYENGIVGR